MEKANSHDGKELFKLIRTFNLANKKQARDISTPIFINDKFIAFAALDVIKIWDIETNQCIQTLQDCEPITNIIQSQDGKKLISYALLNNIKTWELASGTCLKTIPCKVSAISPDGSLYTVIKEESNWSYSNYTIEIYDTSTNILKYSIKNDINNRNIKFSPDNSKFIAESSHCQHAICDIKTNSITSINGAGWRTKYAFNPTNSAQVALINIMHETEDKSDSSEGEDNSDSESEDKESTEDIIEIWDSATKNYFKQFKFNDIDLDTDLLHRSPCFSPDGRYFLMNSEKEGTIKIWDFENNICLQTIFTTIKFGSLFFSPDGTKFALAGTDKETQSYVLNIYQLEDI